MAATTVQNIVDQCRKHLLEQTARLWTDAELGILVNDGLRDLWRAILQTSQDYIATIDTTNVSYAASGDTTLTGVPSDTSIVIMIEPRVLTTFPNLHYRPKRYTHADFNAARSQDAINPEGGLTVWYAPVGAGAPTGAGPNIHVSPKLNQQVLLTFMYVPTLAEVALATALPLPGECDAALVNYTTAYALAKASEKQEPHGMWLQLYSTEKDTILEAISPRTDDEEEVTEAFFELEWPG